MSVPRKSNKVIQFCLAEKTHPVGSQWVNKKVIYTPQNTTSDFDSNYFFFFFLKMCLFVRFLIKPLYNLNYVSDLIIFAPNRCLDARTPNVTDESRV